MIRIPMQRLGFTRVEVIVVVAIIGILAAVVLANLNDARNKGIDSNSVQQVRQIQSALELYYVRNGDYPVGCAIAPGAGTCSWGVPLGTIAAQLTPTYLTEIPVGSDPAFSYRYISSDDPAVSDHGYGILIEFEEPVFGATDSGDLNGDGLSTPDNRYFCKTGSDTLSGWWADGVVWDVPDCDF